MTLHDFLNNNLDRSHVNERGFSTLYLRKGCRSIKSKYYKNVLTIASVSAVKPGNGCFTRLIVRLDKEWSGPIFVESVLTPQFIPLLLRLGFEPLDFQAVLGMSVNFVKNLDRGNCEVTYGI
jgi:hypothetical protein